MTAAASIGDAASAMPERGATFTLVTLGDSILDCARYNEYGVHPARHGRAIDIHRHCLRGDPSWFTRTIEPSLVGASEIRLLFLPAAESARG